jgi:[ribosomal protein S18]-alanine N-acetyltransferase
MMNFVARLIGRAEPSLAEASERDAAAIAAIHAASFQRGWGEDEFRSLLLDRNVVCHRALVGRTLIGFILSRLVAAEAEILSVAIARGWRGRGLSRPLLDLHLRRLAGLGVRTVFLEVDEKNAPAGRLYRKVGFYDVGRRQGYYEGRATALVLRRDLT